MCSFIWCVSESCQHNFQRSVCACVGVCLLRYIRRAVKSRFNMFSLNFVYWTHFQYFILNFSLATSTCHTTHTHTHRIVYFLQLVYTSANAEHNELLANREAPVFFTRQSNCSVVRNHFYSDKSNSKQI